MPVTLIDRLPLPNLKVYTAASVSLLSVAVYYALGVTGEPGWRLNATLARQEALEAAAAAAAAEGRLLQPAPAPLDLANSSRFMSDQLADVLTFMMQEPLCMWTVINMAYCALALLGWGLQRAVFGPLRVAEAARARDKFWNYAFYKFIFVFGVLNVQYMDEVLLWCSWFTALGLLHLLAQLCKDRFEYLSSSPNSARWAHVRLGALLAGVACASAALLAAAAVWALPVARDTFCFMAAECVLVLLSTLHVMARYALALGACDAAGAPAYYTHLAFDALALLVEMLHVLHMVLWANMLVSMASLVLLLQLRHLLHQLQARLRRHRLYTALQHHMHTSYPMASKEEVEKNQDNCAICWEPMKEARKLPCDHLFHNSCLCQWMQQDASCPTCRRALSARPAAPPAPAPAPPVAPAPAPSPVNHLFQFHGSRYVSWLPSFSVAVTRVRREPLGAAQLDALARQVQAMFPHYSLSVLASDLAATRSATLTVDNILEGRLAPPVEPEPEPAPPPPAPPAPVAPIAPVHLEDLQWEPPSEFPESSSERELSLQRRKQQLLARARERYLHKMAAPFPPPPPPTTDTH